MPLRLYAQLSFFVFVLAAYGCGQAVDDSARSPTKAEFVKEADNICSRADATQKADLALMVKRHPTDQATQAGQERLIVAVGLPPVKEETEALRQLQVPAGDEEQIATILQAIEDALKTGESDPGSLLTKSEDPFLNIEKLASDYGFKACDKPG